MAPISDERIARLVEGIAGLNPDEDYTNGGSPRVEALEAITGIAEITGEERDIAWEVYQAQNPPEPGSDGVKAPPEPGSDGAEASPEPEPDGVKAPPEPPEPPTETSKGTLHVVAEGKALTSRKGILGPGDEVLPEYLGKDGATVLEALVEKGLVIIK